MDSFVNLWDFVKQTLAFGCLFLYFNRGLPLFSAFYWLFIIHINFEFKAEFLKCRGALVKALRCIKCTAMHDLKTTDSRSSLRNCFINFFWNLPKSSCKNPSTCFFRNSSERAFQKLQDLYLDPFWMFIPGFLKKFLSTIISGVALEILQWIAAKVPARLKKKLPELFSEIPLIIGT